MKHQSQVKLVVYGRKDCGLCDELIGQLRKVAPASRFEIVVQDVDKDPEWVEKYGDRVPVLVGDNGREICSGEFDREAFSNWVLTRASV